MNKQDEQTPKRVPRYIEYYRENRDSILKRQKALYQLKKDERRAYQREYIRAKRAQAKIQASQDSTQEALIPIQ